MPSLSLSLSLSLVFSRSFVCHIQSIHQRAHFVRLVLSQISNYRVEVSRGWPDQTRQTDHPLLRWGLPPSDPAQSLRDQGETSEDKTRDQISPEGRGREREEMSRAERSRAMAFKHLRVRSLKVTLRVGLNCTSPIRVLQGQLFARLWNQEKAFTLRPFVV